MTTDIYEYGQKIIKEIEEFIETAGLASYEITQAFEEANKHNPDYFISTWRQYINNCKDARAIDETKTSLFKIINNAAAIKRSKEEQKKNQEKDKKNEKIKSDNELWSEYWKKDADYWKKSSEFWSKYDNKEYDWQKDQNKRDEENKKQLQESEKNRDDKNKKEFIGNVEMELIKENVSDERLSKRVGVSDWREKIRQADGFSAALSTKSELIRIVWKLKEEYTCASCGVKKEEYTAYQTGGKKYCSYECDKAAKDKGDNKDNDYPAPNKKKGKWSFSITDLFAAMKKVGIESIDINSTTNEIIVKYKNNTTGKLEDASLPSELKSQVKSEVQASRKPITFSEVSSEFNKEKKDNKGNGIIAAIIIVGILFAVVIGVVLHKNKKRDY